MKKKIKSFKSDFLTISNNIDSKPINFKMIFLFDTYKKFQEFGYTKNQRECPLCQFVLQM